MSKIYTVRHHVQRRHRARSGMKKHASPAPRKCRSRILAAASHRRYCSSAAPPALPPRVSYVFTSASLARGRCGTQHSIACRMHIAKRSQRARRQRRSPRNASIFPARPAPPGAAKQVRETFSRERCSRRHRPARLPRRRSLIEETARPRRFCGVTTYACHLPTLQAFAEEPRYPGHTCATPRWRVGRAIARCRRPFAKAVYAHEQFLPARPYERAARRGRGVVTRRCRHACPLTGSASPATPSYSTCSRRDRRPQPIPE